ncbi:polyketide synthase [Massarina eburnea CBS 473.64]|uniref:Polyketide synthase n=1 Tax=Massarina eburnea CBS 473.64 TaxID=1395130 RepID=A0A6A6RX66_9PLEO|nr:polyketide synthase [Massarina eburnea CBS 473.64]
MTTMDKIFDIVAEEIGIERDELADDAEFAELGVDTFLAKCIVTRILKETKIILPTTAFTDYPTADDLQAYLATLPITPLVPIKIRGAPPCPASPAFVSSGPLSFVLQGKQQTCTKTLFLLPDGSGSGMAYARLPILDPSVCLIALNSPYLKAPTSTIFTVEGVAAQWAAEIQSRQPHGPYQLGGWSAGGYYSFEVAKCLMRKGERVEKLVLIDSPCRLDFEALPMEVVQYLSTNNLMGNWGNKHPPEWMVNHFDISIRAIQRYMPTPIRGNQVPDVCLIWAGEGVLKNGDRRPSPAEVDMGVKITKMLLERPTTVGAQGWDKLFPGKRLEVASMPGNHFTMVYPPNCASLSSLLADSVRDRKRDRRNRWTMV